MKESTNQLVGRVARIGGLTGLAAALVLVGTLIARHDGVNAASISSAAPLDDSSVSSLVALDHAVESVAARVTPAVVNVAVTSKETPERGAMQNQQGQNLPPGFSQFFGPNGFFGQMTPQGPQIEHGIGSGVIISPDGYILTNDHVVNDAVNVRVTLHDRRVLNAKVVGVDKLTDLAVIKVDATDLPTIAWGDSTKLKPGQTVLAFGSPFGYFQFSVTRGIVSALNRPNPYSDNLRKPGGYIQTDAAINPGNSGGPLVNAHGELIGINTFIISNSGSFAGAGFAIPSQLAHSVAEQIIKTGSVHHGYLGIAMNDVTPANASFFNLKDATGAIVSQVTPGSPAADAGLKSGDVIRELNGETMENGSALQVAVSEMTPGTAITLGIIRNGSPQTVHVKVGEFHASGAETASTEGNSNAHAKIGVQVGDLNADVRQQFNIPASVHGAVVEGVKPGSPAEDAGLQAGDVIMEVNRHAVSSAEACVNSVHASPAGKDLLLLVWSQGNASYRIVHPDNSNQ
ncbi:trypsin-like peptidase domain-containing protein [Edaphobacter sp.]|uniref:trypsin-like peptidase domain-containing protein n=1 Tax=Edaphobacter sp. TaxID=1934404 RepID=UPI002DBDCAA3|nr:trypsin-like peptidase domain-containing protein [Edaphobacter sp.]HEU5342131.1 trypsin-like peptidase domain-containing protein [Edaphobacter sp.]